MKGKICLVTGGNAGIGKYTCIGLAKLGARVVLVARNEEKALKAKQEIIEASQNKDIDVLICDLSSQAAIRKMAQEFKERYERLDVLVNNAGAFYDKLHMSPEGYEMQWAVNHLAYFLLTHLLMDRLQAAENARIVNVSSNSHYQGKIRFDNINFDKGSYGGLRAYEQSKLANVLFTRMLAKKLQKEGITANSLHPGVVKTSIAQKHTGSVFNALWSFMKVFAVSEEKGASTSVFLACSKEVEGVSGKFFSNKKVKKESKRAQDDTVAKKLWELSEQQCQLSEEEKI